MRNLFALSIGALLLGTVFAGCRPKHAFNPNELAYFDGKISFSDTGAVFIDRANFVRFVVTEGSMSRLAPVRESIDMTDSNDITRWIELFGTPSRRDSVFGYNMTMYITVDSLIRFSNDTVRNPEVMVGAFEAQFDSMKYQLRVLPNYTYILNEFMHRRNELAVSKTGKWKRIDPYTLLLSEDDCDYRFENWYDYKSDLTSRGADSCDYHTMRYVYDPASATLVEKEKGKIVFWKLFL